MTASTEYDPSIIRDFAGRLYAQANAIIATYTILGALVGALVGAIGGGGLLHDGGAAVVGALLMGLLGSALGLSAGRERAFALKLQAQTALCQLQIEANTRAQLPHVRAA